MNYRKKTQKSEQRQYYVVTNGKYLVTCRIVFEFIHTNPYNTLYSVVFLTRILLVTIKINEITDLNSPTAVPSG